MSNIIKNNSTGYGYNYASLADMAEQNIEIPKMRIKVVEGNDYIEYFDGTDWQLGAKVVLPAMGKANDAQIYGAAVTYARRITTAMAMSVATQDDKEIEDMRKESTQKRKGVNFAEVRANLDGISSVDELNKYWVSLGLSKAQAEALKGDFAKRKEEIGE